MKKIQYKTQGTCSRAISLEINNEGIITSAAFSGGCHGNTQGIAALVVGMDAREAQKKLAGIKCGFRPTSCPDQLARAIDEALAK